MINQKFLSLFDAGGSGSSGSSSGISLTSASTTSITDTLRVGAQTFASSIQSLNSSIGFLQTARDNLEKLEKIAEKTIAIAERAASASTGNAARSALYAEFRQLANQYERITSDAKIGDYEVLSREDLTDALTLVGLDADTSDSIAAIFKKFYLSEDDDSLASENIKGSRPVRVPQSSVPPNVPIHSRDYGSIFSDDRQLRSRPDGYYLLTDSREFQTQIEKNIKAIDYALEVVGKNIELVRGTGFAFLDAASEIKSSDEAEEVVALLQQKIRKNAPAALAQAENLNAIVVATLTLMSEGISYKKSE